MRLGEQWKIELVCTDFESLSYHVGHHRGLPVISIDNQHALTRARLHYPKQHRGEALTAKLVTRLMILHASEYLITAFFPAQLRRKDGTVVSPILRKEVLTAGDREGGYALVYVTSPCRRAGGLNEAHPAVFRVLRIRPPGQDANLVFKKPSLTAFLEDLAGCQAVIANSGFSLISEAL